MRLVDFHCHVAVMQLWLMLGGRAWCLGDACRADVAARMEQAAGYGLPDSIPGKAVVMDMFHTRELHLALLICCSSRSVFAFFVWGHVATWTIWMSTNTCSTFYARVLCLSVSNLCVLYINVHIFTACKSFI